MKRPSPARLALLPLLVLLAGALAGALGTAAPAAAAPQPGQIVVDPEDPRWFRYHGGGPFFMAGPGDPEGFLYRGRQRRDGTRDGDQMKLIRKLAETGANSIYLMAVRSHGGDGGASENPFTGGEPARGLNRKVLDQWEEWFTEMDRAGIVIFFIFYDDGARIWDTGHEVGAEERRFVHALVDRFEHHRHLIWVVAEEYQERYTARRISALAAEIHAADEHDHPVAVHKLGGLDFEEFADDPHIDQFAIQFNVPQVDEVHRGQLGARERAKARYNINYAEGKDWGSGRVARQKAWAAAMGGGYVMAYEMDIARTPRSDLEDYGRLVRFMESTDFHRMEPRDELAEGATRYVLARAGESYIAYALESGPLGLRELLPGDYRLRWLDPASGHEVVESRRLAGATALLPRPAGIGEEAALHLQRIGAETRTAERTETAATTAPAGF